MSTAAPRLCIRCKQQLPEGTGYCIACGCTNDSVMDTKLAKINRDLQWRKTWVELQSMFPFLRWFDRPDQK
jgi:predicted amidophosphoribosyltransferase